MEFNFKNLTHDEVAFLFRYHNRIAGLLLEEMYSRTNHIFTDKDLEEPEPEKKPNHLKRIK